MVVPTSVGKLQKVALPVNVDLALSSPKTNETASVSTCNGSLPHLDLVLMHVIGWCYGPGRSKKNTNLILYY